MSVESSVVHAAGEQKRALFLLEHHVRHKSLRHGWKAAHFGQLAPELLHILYGHNDDVPRCIERFKLHDSVLAV